MSNTYTKIASVTVGSLGATSIDFTSIPSTYTDLQIVTSLRDSTVSTGKDYKIEFNGVTTSYSYKRIYADSTAGYSDTASTGQSLTIDSASATANTFANSIIYVPNYAGSNNKSWSADSATENNASTANSAFLNLYAGLWSNTAAITSISIKPVSGTPTIQQYSTAVLYGIKNS
jgi:hypothetical protein